MDQAPPSPAAIPSNGLREPAKSRVVSFSDNVISIALTLLVLDVRVPSDLKQLTFASALHILGPRLASFTLSFTIVGVYWVGHHLIFENFQRVGRPLLWLNNLFLLMVTLVPASAALLGSFPGQRAAVALYGLNITLVSASLLFIMLHGVRFHRQNHLPLDEIVTRIGFQRTWSGLLIACLGMLLAWVNPWLSYAIYWITPVAFALVQFAK
jgi:uncharacterized membrane protein